MCAARAVTAACFGEFKYAQRLLSAQAGHVGAVLEPSHLEDELGRFRIWAANIGALAADRSALEHRLQDALPVLGAVMAALKEIWENLKQMISILSGERAPDELSPPEGASADPAADGSSETSGSDSDDSGSDDDEAQPPELDIRLKLITGFITSLFKLSITIRRPVFESRREKASAFKSTNAETGVDLFSAFEAFDFGHTRELFEQSRDARSSPKDTILISRFARAITNRRRQFAYLQKHREKLATGIKDVVSSTAPREPSLEGRTGKANLMEPAPSLRDLVSKAQGPSSDAGETRLTATTATVFIPPADNFSQDNRSATSYGTSYMKSHGLDAGKIDYPPLPKSSTQYGHFECPYCFEICSPSVSQTTRSWRRHILRDLRPYICTYESCPVPDELYDSRHAWATHEQSTHQKVWRCSDHGGQSFPTRESFIDHVMTKHHQLVDSAKKALVGISETTAPDSSRNCPICMVQLATRKQAQRHIGRHCERLALFALPTTLSEFEDSEEAHSMSHHVRPSSHGYTRFSYPEGSVLSDDPTPFEKAPSPARRLTSVQDEVLDLLKALESCNFPSYIPRRHFSLYGLLGEHVRRLSRTLSQVVQINQEELPLEMLNDQLQESKTALQLLEREVGFRDSVGLSSWSFSKIKLIDRIEFFEMQNTVLLNLLERANTSSASELYNAIVEREPPLPHPSSANFGLAAVKQKLRAVAYFFQLLRLLREEADIISLAKQKCAGLLPHGLLQKGLDEIRNFSGRSPVATLPLTDLDLTPDMVEDMSLNHAMKALCNACQLIETSVQAATAPIQEVFVRNDLVSQLASSHSLPNPCELCSIFLQLIKNTQDESPRSSATSIQIKLKIGIDGSDMDGLVLDGSGIDPISVELCTSLGSGLTQRIRGRSIVPSPTSESCLSKVRAWFDSCVNDHTSCKVDAERSLPPRLIYIGRTNTDTPFLVDSSQIKSRVTYAILSNMNNRHSGGTPMRAAERKVGEPLLGLPKQFQDAISLVRKLDIPYLWIASVCGASNAQVERQHESPEYARYLRNSILTIVPANAQKSSFGLLSPRDTTNIYSFSKESSNFPENNLEPTVHLRKPLVSPSQYLSQEQFLRRAEAFQDYILSPRVLYYGTQQTLWDCNMSSFSEDNSVPRAPFWPIKRHLGLQVLESDASSEKLSEETRESTYKSWYMAIQDLSKLEHEAHDRLQSVAQIADIIKERVLDRYYSGVWAADTVRGLLWARRSAFLKVFTGNQSYQTPSWSWAAVDGEIYFPALEGDLKQSPISSNVAKFQWVGEGHLDIVARSNMMTQETIRSPVSRVSFDQVEDNDLWNGGADFTFCLMTKCLLNFRKDWVGLILKDGNDFSRRVGFALLIDEDVARFGPPRRFSLR